jgi:hypothetical protein
MSDSKPSKEVLAQTIKEWLVMEKELKVLQKEISERKKRKKELSDTLVHVMKNNEVDCFDINDGKIIYSQSHTKSPLNKVHILDSLNAFFAKMPDIPTQDIVQYILDRRTVVTKDNIRHKPV